MALCCKPDASDEEAADGTTRKSGLVPRSKRKCRDVFCCLLFLAYWLGMAIIAILALKSGNPVSLVYGRDYNGSICGDGDMIDRRLTAFPRLNDDMLAAVAHGVSLTKMPFFGVCVSTCPQVGEEVCTNDNSTCWTTALDTTPVFFRCVPLNGQNETILAETCLDPPDADPACTLARYNQKECSVVCKTKRVQKSVWEVEETTPNPLLEQLQGHLQLLGRFVSDTKAAVGLILLVGGAGAMVLGVLWLVILQFFAGCMIWLTCMLVVLILVLMSLFCSVRSGMISSEALEGLAFLNGTNTSATIDLNSNAFQATGNASDRLQFKAAAYVLWVLTGIFLLLLLAMRKRIHIAIAIIRESSRAIKTLPLLLLWPVVPTIAFVLLVMYAVTIAAYIMSSADMSSVLESTAALATASTGSTSSSVAAINGTLSEIPSDKIQQVLLVYHLFGFLWTNQLFHAISICTIAGSVAQYYWTPPDGNNRRKLEARFPIARALRNVLRFSLGSLCFGSFIIALVQLLRILLEYVDHQTKELQQGNRVVKVAFLAVRCCLWCFEKCLKFLSKNAYILIAMRGNSFCSASVASFKLLFKNIARVAVVNSISFFLLLLVKTTITLTVAGVVFVALSNASASSQLEVLGTEPVTSPMAPVLVASVLSWLVASAFMNIYDAAIDTILLCFCEDTELHGEGSSEFMSPELRRIMGDTGSKPKVVHVGPATSVTKSGSGGGGEPGGNKVHVDNDEI